MSANSLSRKARRHYSAAKIAAFEAKWGNPRGYKKAAKRHGKLALRYEDMRAIEEGLEELEMLDPLDALQKQAQELGFEYYY